MSVNRYSPIVVTLAAVAALALAGCTGAAAAPESFAFPTGGSSAVPTATPAPPSIAAPSSTPGLGFVPGTTASPRIVNMTANDSLEFRPGAIVVAQGETVTLRVKVTGKGSHEFMVGPAADVFADKEGTPEIEGLTSGKTRSITYTFKGPGPYAFACHAPGHFEHGMKGWFIVVGPDVPAVGTKANPRLVHLDMTDQLKFSPDKISVVTGETVRFILTNSGKATHEFQVGPADKVAKDQVDGKLVVEQDEIVGGMTADVVYTFNGAGPYAFGCHEPGHYEAGMEGTVVLTAP